MTNKQRKAAEKAVENGGNISRAMRDAGYSNATAKNPKKLVYSKGWQALLNIYLPDDDLLQALAYDISNNPGNRKAYLELAFKLKGKLQQSVQIESSEMSNFQKVVDGDRAEFKI